MFTKFVPIRYLVNFTATNISYQRIDESPSNSTLDSLCFSFELTIEQDQVNISEVPIVTIHPRDLGFEASITGNNGSLPANRLTPRLFTLFSIKYQSTKDISGF